MEVPDNQFRNGELLPPLHPRLSSSSKGFWPMPSLAQCEFKVNVNATKVRTQIISCKEVDRGDR